MRESEIRPAALLDEYLRLSAADAEVFFPGDGARGHRSCPGCGGDAPVPTFEKNGFRLVRCGTCATLYANPGPEGGRLAAFYRDSPSQRYWAEVFFPAVAEARRERVFRPRVRRIAELVATRGPTLPRILDVGAGAGIFLEECRAVGFGAAHAAIEPSRRLAALCREKGLETFEGFAADAAADPAWRGRADLVTCFEVIEHVLDALAFVRNLADVARPGGMVLMTGLCGTGFDILSLGQHAKAVSPPHHLNFLSRRGAAALLQRSGLEEVAFLTPGELDVDIVCNTLAENRECVVEPFVRHLALDAAQSTRDAFQRFLADHGLSSHMWILARRPA